MNQTFINFAYTLKGLLEIIKDISNMQTKQEKIEFIKSKKFTFSSIIISLIFKEIILLITGLCIGFIAVFVVGNIVNWIPFNSIHNKLLHDILAFFAQFFNYTYNDQLPYPGEWKSWVGVIWIVIGSIFIWRSIFIYNFHFKTGPYWPQPYNRGILALIARLAMRSLKFTFAIIFWPIFFLLKLPSKNKLLKQTVYH